MVMARQAPGFDGSPWCDERQSKVLRAHSIRRAVVIGAVGAALVMLPPVAANAAPVAPTPGPGDHVGQLLGGGNAPSEAQQPRGDAGGWVEHRGATGAQCMDRGVVCDTGIWYPDNLQRQGSQDEGGRSEWVQMPDQTGAECENPGVICGSTAS